MLKNVLPQQIYEVTKKLNYNKIYEIRFRLGQPVAIDYAGLFFLCEKGITDKHNDAFICTKNMIDEVINKVTEKSVYAFNEQIKQGFLTARGGIRIGLCGECVSDNKTLKTIKAFNSLNIRVPHEVKNCSLKLLNFVATPEIQNTLILSPPGAGKTTILRDLCYQLSNRYFQNTLVIDERNEIANCVNGVAQHNIGEFTDVITNSNKLFGFENGIRSMNPQIVVADELANAYDIDAIEYALSCGVKVVATCHCSSIEELKIKKNFSRIISDQLFSRYIVLSKRNGPGTLESIYAGDLSCLYL